MLAYMPCVLMPAAHMLACLHESRCLCFSTLNICAHVYIYRRVYIYIYSGTMNKHTYIYIQIHIV